MTMQPSYFSLLLAAAALSTITSSSASFPHPEVAPSALSPEPEVEALAAGFEDSNFSGPANSGFPDSNHKALGQLSEEPKSESEAKSEHSNEIYNGFNHRDILARRSAEPEPEAEAEQIGKSLFKFNNKMYYPGQGFKFNNNNYPGQGWQDTIRSGVFHFKERRSAEADDPKARTTKNSLLARGLSIWISLWVKQ